jgi:hypothetical protein
MKMVSVAYTKAEQKEEAVTTIERPKFPYGLCLSLDDETLSKLKMELPEVGDEVHLSAVAKVVSVSSRADESDTDQRVELQITMLGVFDESEDDEDSEEDENREQQALASGKQIPVRKRAV